MKIIILFFALTSSVAFASDELAVPTATPSIILPVVMTTPTPVPENPGCKMAFPGPGYQTFKATHCH